MSFFRELKRRNVYRVAALYVVVSWLVLQVTDVTASVLSLPEWAGKLVFLLLAAGFPVALVLAWAFELTPEGLRRERPGDAGSREERGASRPLDWVIVALLLLVLGSVAWQRFGGAPSGPAPEAAAPGEIRSLVVLPLENLINDPDQAYFVAGMHEALITELSRIEALRVISRTSAKAFENSGLSVPEIGRELGVDAVVEGSVLKAGDTVRVTVQLIEAATDRHLWADNFDRPLRDILSLYGEVTREIADQVRVNLSAEQQSEFARSPAVDPEAYERYLEGRYLCDQWRPADMARGMRLLREAIAREPGGAAAHAALALCLQYAAFFGYEKPLDVVDEARALTRTAVEEDPGLAEAWVARAGVQYYLDFDPPAAAVSLERALAINPSSVKALMHYSWMLGESGRFEKAFPINERALELDPLSTIVVNAMGQLYYLSRDFDGAVTYYGRAMELDPTDPSMQYFLARALEQRGWEGDVPAAIERHETAVTLSGGEPLYRAALAYSYAQAGFREEAERIGSELEAGGVAAPYDLALVHLGLENFDTAIEWLEKAYDARDSHVIYIKQDVRFDPLRDRPRFRALYDRIDWLEAEDQ
ncbi:MAG: tetratricopeptide repeat protein [Gammaproteobacteria bacterium]